MTHEDAGKYGAKHPAGEPHDPAIVAALEKKAKDGRITCSAAHVIAENLRVAPSEIGKTADLLEYRILECQLGLFGYSPEKRIVTAPKDIPDDLRENLQRYAADGKISCASCWKIADDLSIERMAVSAGCELLNIKIGRCQLGAF